ncbi:MAG: type 1 glutamine amidotransferase domain-containing protein [Pseudomonadota bacterium]
MKKILAIASNANPELKGKKTGLWLSELTHFLDEIIEAGYEYDIASPNGGEISLDENSITTKQLADPSNVKLMANARFKSLLKNSLKVLEANVAEYDAIYLSGGHGTMFDFRQSTNLQTIITKFHSQGKILSGVCHGVAGFIDSIDSTGAKIVRNKRVTGFSNLEDIILGTHSLMPFLLETELKNNGALYKKNFFPFTKRVEIDGKLITGQNPQSAKAVGSAVVKTLSI